MSDLFKKAACLTDIHFGLKSNSSVHNQDCEDFVDWFIKTAKENDLSLDEAEELQEFKDETGLEGDEALEVWQEL